MMKAKTAKQAIINNEMAGPKLARLTVWQLICYGALSMPIAMGGLVLVTFIPTYYAVDLGLGLGPVSYTHLTLPTILLV